MDATAENGGQVVFSQVPFGEYTANQLTSDNPNDVQNSVYSRNAAIERKIEIQSVSYMKDNEKFAIVSDIPVKDAGVRMQGEVLRESFKVKNESTETVELNTIRVACDCVTAKASKMILSPGEIITVEMEFDTKSKTGFTVESIYLSLKDQTEELRLYISTEIK